MGNSKEIPSKALATPIEYNLGLIEHLTKYLRRYAILTFFLTASCLATSFIAMFGSLGLVDSFGSYAASRLAIYGQVYYFSLGLGAASLALIVFYESLKKRGEALFEEISDELEWDVRGSEGRQSAEGRPELRARIALRTFARTTDLPLIPGKYGPAIYAVLVIGILAVAMSLSRGRWF